MQMIILFGLFVTSLANPLAIGQLASQPIPPEDEKLAGQELVDYVNKKQQLFEAVYPTESHTADLMDSKYVVIPKESERAQEVDYSGEIPESYDARKAYPECPSLNYVRDQSGCGSCWAVSALSAFSDRACIQSKGKIKTIYSDLDILSCCGTQCGSGCSGGYTQRTWSYLQEKGACSGGAYHSKGVCKPYPFPPCDHHTDQVHYGKCGKYPTPACTHTCQPGYAKPYESDRLFDSPKSAYYVPCHERAIQKEILVNGPVQAAFHVYDDFLHYKGGIYNYTTGEYKGGHAIKIVGWGVEKGTKYWIIANSWNKYWGEDGYFRMLRGISRCSLEYMVVAGMINV